MKRPTEQMLDAGVKVFLESGIAENDYPRSEMSSDRLVLADVYNAMRALEARAPGVEALAAEILALPRYDCHGPEGGYSAGMEPGDGYVDFYALEKIVRRLLRAGLAKERGA